MNSVAGSIIRKIVKQGANTLYEQDYNGGLEYRKTPASGTFRIEALYHEEGRYFNLNVDANNTVSWRKEYAIRDHLGNTRLMFADKNANGIVEITGNASTNEILQENHYYPFGLSFEGPAWMNDAARDNKYQYNGKEWNDDFGLNWNDYGARYYDPCLGRFMGVDPLASDFPSWTPYHYVHNNPLRYTDPMGMSADDIIDIDKKTGNVTVTEAAGDDVVRLVNEGNIESSYTYGKNGSFCKENDMQADKNGISVYMVDGDKAQTFFEFAANSNVEFGKLDVEKDGNIMSVVTTSHSSSETATLAQLYPMKSGLQVSSRRNNAKFKCQK